MHPQDRAFIECLYCHYDDRLQDPTLPTFIREQFLEKQQILAEQYFMTFLPPHQKFFCKLLKLSHMHNPQQVPVDTDVIRHMAQIIEKRIQENKPVFIDSNGHRIALTDSNGCIIAWCKSNS
jgi:hypothetical protein